MKKFISGILLAGMLMSCYVETLAAASTKNIKSEVPDLKNPLGCKDVGYRFILNTVQFLPDEVGERNSLYFVYNKNNDYLRMYQMRKDGESVGSTYINHAIPPHSWAVLSTSEPIMNYLCAIETQKSSYGKIVSCKEQVRVCEYTNVKFGLNTRGNYWLVKGNTSGGAIQEVLSYGIIPR